LDYRSRKAAFSFISWLAAAALFTSFTLYTSQGYGLLGGGLIAGAFFMVSFLGRQSLFRRADDALYRAAFSRGSTKLLSQFTERVRTCFTMPEFIAAIREDLERALDASVVLIKSNTWDLVYASPASLTADPGMLPALKKNYRELSDGIGYLDDRYALTVKTQSARGFFILGRGYYFFVFSRACTGVDQDAYRILHAEIIIFFDRVLTVSRLFQIAALSKEWRLIADTQRTFLPQKLPEHPKLSLSAYFRPLVNVSGDFYDAIPIDADRTLLVMGDVSGKGLAAALIMGIAINTIRAANDKQDLASLVRKCDNAIREMGFDDKYIVLFLGLADLKKNTLRYVNAAMNDQFLVVRTVRGPVIKRLESNNSIIGLLPFTDITVDETELRTDDILILSTDGLTELENEEGTVLEESNEFTRLLSEANNIDIDDLVDRLATLGESYIGGKALKDDITILAAKVGRLWD
jgi:serine phosphatase RsbU (regulator of sigma subunit)